MGEGFGGEILRCGYEREELGKEKSRGNVADYNRGRGLLINAPILQYHERDETIVP